MRKLSARNQHMRRDTEKNILALGCSLRKTQPNVICFKCDTLHADDIQFSTTGEDRPDGSGFSTQDLLTFGGTFDLKVEVTSVQLMQQT